jgi:hypothetical protein
MEGVFTFGVLQEVTCSLGAGAVLIQASILGLRFKV